MSLSLSAPIPQPSPQNTPRGDFSPVSVCTRAIYLHRSWYQPSAHADGYLGRFTTRFTTRVGCYSTKRKAEHVDTLPTAVALALVAEPSAPISMANGSAHRASAAPVRIVRPQPRHQGGGGASVANRSTAPPQSGWNEQRKRASQCFLPLLNFFQAGRRAWTARFGAIEVL